MRGKQWKKCQNPKNYEFLKKLKKKKPFKSFDIHQPPSRAVGKLSFELNTLSFVWQETLAHFGS